MLYIYLYTFSFDHLCRRTQSPLPIKLRFSKQNARLPTSGMSRNSKQHKSMAASGVYTADKCLPGWIQRELKSRLQIFITWCTQSAAEGVRRGETSERDRQEGSPKKIQMGFGEAAVACRPGRLWHPLTFKWRPRAGRRESGRRHTVCIYPTKLPPMTTCDSIW